MFRKHYSPNLDMLSIISENFKKFRWKLQNFYYKTKPAIDKWDTSLYFKFFAYSSMYPVRWLQL